MDLVLVSCDFFSQGHTMSEDGALFHDGFWWDVRGSDKTGPETVSDCFCIQCIGFYLGFCDCFRSSHVHEGCLDTYRIKCFVDVVPGAGGFDGCLYVFGFEAFHKSFDVCCIAFELLFCNDISCFIHGCCLDKVFMDIHSYMECTHNGISPPCSCVSWGGNDRYLFVLRWHILTGRY